jgi:hypothetical protein
MHPADAETLGGSLQFYGPTYARSYGHARDYERAGYLTLRQLCRRHPRTSSVLRTGCDGDSSEGSEQPPPVLSPLRPATRSARARPHYTAARAPTQLDGTALSVLRFGCFCIGPWPTWITSMLAATNANGIGRNAGAPRQTLPLS